MMLAEGLLYLGEFVRAHAHAEREWHCTTSRSTADTCFHYGNDSG